jgi:hypothetical protein
VSAVVDAVKSVVGVIVDAVKDYVSFVWNEIVMPQLEAVFSVFGIEDETVVETEKISTKLFDDNTDDVIKAAKTRALMRWLKTDNVSFWKHIVFEMNLTRGRVDAYYNYAKKERYIYGLPSMSIEAENKNEPAIKASIDTEYTIDSVVIYSSNNFPTAEEYFKADLQSAPTNYKPGLDQLTYDNEWGVSFSDWSLSDITYIDGSNEYEITVTRTSERTYFWIEGPTEVTEGGTANLIVRCNRPVPAGESVTVNFVYSGSTASSQYTALATAVMGAGSSSVTVQVEVTEDAISEALGNIVVTMDSITNTNGAFEDVVITDSAVDISVYDNDSLVLTMNSKYVNESDTSVTIPVRLSQAASAGFTVDYQLSDGTAVAGIDYDGTGGTLTFAGTAGEVQNIVVPLTADVTAEAREDFFVSLLNCSDGTINISRTATITIMDALPNGPVADTSEYSITFTRPQFIDESSMVCKYYIVGEDPEDWYYWIYNYSAGTYPDIDPTKSTISELEMLPVGIVRKDKVNVDLDKDSDEYRTTRNLLKYVQLNLDDLLEGITDNPDADTIDDAYVNFAVCPKDTGPEVAKLLYLTFYEIIHVRGISSNSERYSAIFEEQDVNNANVWSGHSYTTDIIGSIGTVGEHTHTVEIIPGELDQFGNAQDETTKLILRFQRTESFYDEITVDNMNGMSSIKYDGYHKTTFNNIKDDSFTIPLSWYVYEQLTNEELMKVYQKIFRIDLYSITITNLNWYETEAFFKFIKFAMVVVAVVTTILSGGFAGGFWAGMWTLLQQFVIGYIVMEIAVAIAEATGSAFLAAAVALVAGFVLRDFSGLQQLGFLSAGGITAAISTYSAALGTVYKKEYEDMVSETEKLMEEMEEKEEYYEENSPAGGAILDASFYASLNSFDSMMYQARDAQYDYNAQLTGSYDRLISNYHSLLLDLGIN